MNTTPRSSLLRRGSGFNSLLEMQYRTTEPVVTDLKPEGFNSLLEMRVDIDGDPAAGQVVRVSILYWRCGIKYIPHIVCVDGDVSILYWRCTTLRGAKTYQRR